MAQIRLLMMMMMMMMVLVMVRKEWPFVNILVIPSIPIDNDTKDDTFEHRVHVVFVVVVGFVAAVSCW